MTDVHVEEVPMGIHADQDEVEIDVTDLVSNVTKNTEIRLLKIDGKTYRLTPSLSAIAMANITSGIDEKNLDFDRIIKGVAGMFRKGEDRDNFIKWIEDAEPDMEVVMTIMGKAMEILTAKK